MRRRAAIRSPLTRRGLIAGAGAATILHRLGGIGDALVSDARADPLAPKPPQHLSPLFDAHIHYNDEIAALLKPEDAARRLREAGIVRAIVSSTPDDHTLELAAAAPDLVIPFLRPYRSHGDRGGWLGNGDVLAEIERRLARTAYRGIGEFHINPLAPPGSILPRIVHLARERRLWILAHVAAGVIDQMYALDPDARIIWAHAGGLVETAETVAIYMARYPSLVLELSLRSGLTHGDQVAPVWRAMFEAARGRVLLGTDTWVNARWDEVRSVAADHRRWLASLPETLAGEIALGNGRRMFG